MNAERLLGHYERIADAPDAILRFRRFILDLAARGKLVPQDPNDEPALELLKRIAVEKVRAVQARQGDAEPTEANQQPFSIPSGWTWTRLGYIADLVRG